MTLTVQNKPDVSAQPTILLVSSPTLDGCLGDMAEIRFAPRPLTAVRWSAVQLAASTTAAVSVL